MGSNPPMRILLVNPEYPTTYWGFQLALPLAGRRVSLPPLGLVTVAACLPESWTFRLVELNARPLDDDDLAWADVVMIGGMRVQAPSMHEVLRRARAMGRRTVVGGPAATTSPQEFDDADVVFQGELEGRQADLVAAIEAAGRVRIEASPDRPDVTTSPTPRFDLLRLDDYASMCVQFSRGCPYSCEFCDIIEMFGRVPRFKSNDQVLTELDALRALGYVGPLFFVDDNFIGNKRAVRALLPAVTGWQREHEYVFGLYTEASVNLADDDALLDGMVEAGFTGVFLGIETPSAEALAGAKKTQNLRRDLTDGVRHIAGKGLEVMGGFIVGFDEDGVETFERQRAFITSLPLPLAMVGILTALPETALYRRLAKEGRLRETSSGDAFARPNFEPVMCEGALLRGYGELLASLYEPAAYYARVQAHVARAPALPGRRRIGLREVVIALRTSFVVGLLSPWRRHYWRALWRTLLHAPHALAFVVEKAIQGQHMIRYTRERVLPRIERALVDLAGERLAPSPDHAPRPAPVHLPVLA